MTEDLPFFGFDTVRYDVLDKEGELSNQASIDVLVRPDPVSDGQGGEGPPVVLVRDPATGETAEAVLAVQTFGPEAAPIVVEGTARDGYASVANLELDQVHDGNDLIYVTSAATLFGRSGNDVLIARGSTENVALFGGNNTDWLEGGSGDDFLASGRIGEEAIGDPHGVLALGAPFPPPPPNILLGGPGDDVFAVGLDVAGGVPDGTSLSRDNVIDLGEGNDILAPGLTRVGFGEDLLQWVDDVTIDGETLTRTEAAARALEGDLVRSFGEGDKLILPISGGRLDQLFIDQILVTDYDVRQDMQGERPRGSYEDGYGWIPSDALLAGSPYSRANVVAEFENGYPQMAILRYVVETQRLANQGGPDETEVTLRIEEFAYTFYGGLSESVADPFFPRDPLVGDDFEFKFRLEGDFNADRFLPQIVRTRLTDDAPFLDAPGVGMAAEGLEDPRAAHVDLALGGLSDVSGARDGFGLALRYLSRAPEAADDVVSVMSGEVHVIDVLANDVDPDGDDLRVFDFATPDDFAGALEAEVDPVTGLFTGRFTFVAPEDFDVATSFTYVVEDDEFRAAPATVTLAPLGLPVAPAADLIGRVPGTWSFLPVAAALANDADPDGDPLDPTRVALALDENGDPLDFGGLVSIDDVPDPLGGDDIRAFVLDLALLQDLDDGGLTDFSFSYTVEDARLADAGAAQTLAPATVVITRAEPLSVDAPPPVLLQEDASQVVDVFSAVTGGFGAVEIVSLGLPEAPSAGDDPVTIGEAELTGAGVRLTPLPDLFGISGVLPVVLRDETGVEVELEIAFEIAAVEDPAFLAVLPAADDAPPLPWIVTAEDLPAAAVLAAVDLDAIDPGAVDLAEAAALLAQLREAPGEVDLDLLETLLAGGAEIMEEGALVTDRGGVLLLGAASEGPLRSAVYTPDQDFAGVDGLDLTLREPVSGGGFEERVLRLEMRVAPVNDAPDLDPDADGPLDLGVVAQEQTALFDVLAGSVDVDGPIDPTSFVISAAPDPALLEIDVDPITAELSLTGIGFGDAVFELTVADALGARSAPREARVRVNAVPIAAEDRVELSAPFVPLLIDAIANDEDPDGVLSYVLDDDGRPAIIGPESGGLLGSVAWSEADDAFLYTAPQDGSGAGETDVFYYEVEDENGAVARGSVLIDLRDPEAGDALFGSDGAETFEAGPGEDLFVLGKGEDRVEGPLRSFDGDTVADLDAEDTLLVRGASSGLTVSVERLLSTPTATPSAAPGAPSSGRVARTTLSSEAPSSQDLLGVARLSALTASLAGDTRLRLSDGDASAVVLVSGYRAGAFDVAPEAGGSALRYGAVTSGDGDVAGTEGADDLRGGDGADSLDAFAGDDALRGESGDDRLFGGAGSDVLFGGLGLDTLTGGAGADLFVIGGAAEGDLILDFAPRAGDRIAIALPEYLDDGLRPAHDRLRVIADDGAWALIGDPDGEDGDAPEEVLVRIVVAGPEPGEALQLIGDGGRNALRGGATADFLDGRGGADDLRGGGGNDALNGGAGADVLRGNGGADLVKGGAGGDRALGGGGNDRLAGGGGGDVLKGGGGRDRLDGGGGRDRLDGGGGRDALEGKGGRDALEGGAGRDVLQGGRGRDDLHGGRGRDVFHFERRDGRDEILDWADGRDKVRIERGADRFRDLEIRDSGDDALVFYGRKGDVVRLKDVDADDLGRGDFVFG